MILYCSYIIYSRILRKYHIMLTVFLSLGLSLNHIIAIPGEEISDWDLKNPITCFGERKILFWLYSFDVNDVYFISLHRFLLVDIKVPITIRSENIRWCQLFLSSASCETVINLQRRKLSMVILFALVHFHWRWKTSLKHSRFEGNCQPDSKLAQKSLWLEKSRD